MVWGQGGCRTCDSMRICPSNNPGMEALFKPLAFVARTFECDVRRTLLVDDAPIKGCVNNASNCFFPQSFNAMRKILFSWENYNHTWLHFNMNLMFVEC